MINNLPISINFCFVVITLLCIWFLFKASNYSKTILFILLGWIILQAVLGLSGFYLITDTFPPRFLLLVVLPIASILVLFISQKGKIFIDNLDLKILTILHIIRIPVELVLYWLYLHKAVPELMTFEGRNFDILAGISAPFVYYFGFVRKKLNKIFLLLWNIVCLGLLINIVVTAVLSAPFPFQQFAFNQPNIAVLYFPFVWLPCCVVPIVFFAHLTLIRSLLSSDFKNKF